MGEVVGLTLAILPLILCAAEHFEDISRPISRFRKFDVRVKAFEAQLSVQQTLYREETCLLVGKALGRVEALAMFEDYRHPAWTDRVMQEKLEQYLGASMKAVQVIIEAIEEQQKTVSLISPVLDRQS